MATRIPTASRNAACDAIVDRLDIGTGTATVEIRTGAQPDSANDAATGTLLVTLNLPDPVFGDAVDGVATANAIAKAEGAADGNAGWFRAKNKDGNAVMDGNATATGGGGQMTLNNTNIVTGQDVTIVVWTATAPSGDA